MSEIIEKNSKENQTEAPLIRVKDLKQYFNINMGLFRSKPLKAVDGVSFYVNRGETLGLVGESGCGKTTVGRTLLHLYKPTGGEILYNGKPIVTKADVAEFRKKAAMVFQDPYSSLNPRMTVADIIAEPLDVHHLYTTKEERREKVLELMATVRIVMHGNGDVEILPLEFTYLWCSRPGGFRDSYTVVPVEEYIGRKEEWLGPWEYDKMVDTYIYVKEQTGIEDKNTKTINE